jgi:hypothetical protein
MNPLDKAGTWTGLSWRNIQADTSFSYQEGALPMRDTIRLLMDAHPKFNRRALFMRSYARTTPTSSRQVKCSINARLRAFSKVSGIGVGFVGFNGGFGRA